MPSDTTLVDHVREWMRRGGWTEQSSGDGGSLWTSGVSGRSVAVPADLESDLRAFDGVVKRLADVSHADTAELGRKLRNWATDVTYVRASSDFVRPNTIPLQAGAVLLASTRTMFRAAATAALRRRASIGSNYSKLGDGVADAIRMDQTQTGSYVIPILVPVGHKERYVVGNEKQSALFESVGAESVDEVESPERRMTRTYAEALTAVDDLVITPERSPRTDSIVEMVNRGVTREFVTSMANVLEEVSVPSIDTTFEWAETQGAPRNVKDAISIPHEAAELLLQTATKLKQTQLPSNVETFVGPIVMVAQEPRERAVHFAIRTVRHSRPCRVESTTVSNSLEQVTRWMRNQTSVTLAGKVRRLRGVLTIDSPTTLVSAELSLGIRREELSATEMDDIAEAIRLADEKAAIEGVSNQIPDDPAYVDPLNPPRRGPIGELEAGKSDAPNDNGSERP